MAKRFTDTEKWKRPWYRKLPPPLRELWNYILDSCDHAGIWVEDVELAGMILGFEVNLEDYEKHLGPKLIRVDEDKVFVPSFVEFQYGSLDPDCKTHKSVIQILERYSIDTVTLQLAKGIETLPKGIDTLQDKDKDKDKDQDQKKEEGGMGETKNSPSAPTTRFDFEPIYQEYPRKEGKNAGLVACKTQIKTQESYDQLLFAVRRYREHCEREGTEKDYIQHFSTFMNKGRWKDWLDQETGTAIETQKAHYDLSRFT